MPAIAPSPDYGRSVDVPFTVRAMVLQAWGSLGTAWPVVRQHLSVRTAARLTLGHTLPRAAEAAAVTLDGAPLAGMCPRTHRGEEVLVDVGATSGAHALAVRVR